MSDASPDAPEPADVRESSASRRARIDREYDNSAAFSDVPEWRESWRRRSEAVAAGPAARLDVAYGPAPAQKLDIFPCGHATAPTALFIHGGFWTRNSKETFRFLVQGVHAAGCNAAFIGYTLAPNARMDQMVDEVRSGGHWLFSRLAGWGMAQRPLIAIGWSAGAQLAAMMMGERHIAAGIGISGVYDLRPMRDASVNDALQLSADEARRNSPTLQPPRYLGQFIVAYGARELPAFQSQSENFYSVLRDAGASTGRMALPQHTHHSILEELYQPNGALVSELARLAS
jgi:arylformamidase